jgi:hypothetical protein
MVGNYNFASIPGFGIVAPYPAAPPSGNSGAGASGGGYGKPGLVAPTSAPAKGGGGGTGVKKDEDKVQSPGTQPSGEVLSVQKTTGQDKYEVKYIDKTSGELRSSLLTGEQTKAMGGALPTGSEQVWRSDSASGYGITGGGSGGGGASAVLQPEQTTTPETTSASKNKVLSVAKTTGADKYKVRYYDESGELRTALMRGAQVTALGGVIPQGTQQYTQKYAGPSILGDNYKALSTDYFVKELVEKQGMSEAEARRIALIALRQPNAAELSTLPVSVKRSIANELLPGKVFLIEGEGITPQLLTGDDIKKIKAAPADSPEYSKMLKALRLIPQDAQTESEFREKLRESDPYLYKIYIEGGVGAYKAAVEKRTADLAKIQEQFNKEHITIGEKALKVDDWNSLDPKYQHIALTDPRGFDAMYDAIDTDRKIWENNLRHDDPYLYQVYKEGGVDAYSVAVGKREADLAGIYERNYITLPGGSMVLKTDWDNIDPKYQDIGKSKGYDEMAAQIDADIAAYDKALLELAPYSISEEPSAVSSGITPEKKSISLGENPQYDIVKYLKDHPGRTDTLAAMNFTPEAIENAKYFAKLNKAQAIWQGATPWNEQKGEKATPKGVSIMAAENLVPGVYEVRHWSEMSAADRVMQVSMDAIFTAMMLVPVVGAAGEAARTVGIASKTARFAAAAKAAGGMALRQIAPVDAVIHPLKTAKGAVTGVRNLMELLADPNRVTEAAITNASGQIMFRAEDFGSIEKARLAADELMARIGKGEKPLVRITGDSGEVYEIELRPSTLMKETGGYAHATTDLTPHEQGLEVAWKKGEPVKEQGLFLSPEPTTQYVPQSATGKGAIPISTDASGRAERVWYYKPEDIAKMDADPIRPVNFADAEGIPKDAAPIIENIAKKYDAKVAGSLNTYAKVPKAKRPHDIDLIFDSPQEAIRAKDEIMDSLKNAGFETKMHPIKRIIYIKDKGKFREAVDLWTKEPYDKLIGNELAQPTKKIDGFNMQTLGEGYIHQAYGSVSQTEKVTKRIKAVDKMSRILEEQLKADGAIVRRPGVVVWDGESETARAAASTDKLFYAFTPIEKGGPGHYGWVKELESKLPPGVKAEPTTQTLWFRTGPRGVRVELILNKPISYSTVQKLKTMGGLIADLKAPFQPAITIRSMGEGRLGGGYRSIIKQGEIGLTEVEVRDLARTLYRAGNITRKQAADMIGAIRIVTRAAMPQITNLREARAGRLRTLAAIRATPRPLPAPSRITRASERAVRESGRPVRLSERPVRPVEERPVRSIEERPVRPVEERPVRPVEERPVRPVEERPVRPVEERPVRPVEERPVRPPILRRRHGESDGQKRQIVRESHAAVTYVRGKLGRVEKKGVWHTWIKRSPESDWERVIVIGAKPEGAIYATGPNSARLTMQRLSGLDEINIMEDTGAVDTVIKGESGEKKIQAGFVKDMSVKRHRGKEVYRNERVVMKEAEGKTKNRRIPGGKPVTKEFKQRAIDLGAGVVREGKWQHIEF